MRNALDERVVPPPVVALVRELHSRAPCHLAGGAAMLAWLLRDFPVSPLPRMLEPLDQAGLAHFRDALSERFKRIAVP